MPIAELIAAPLTAACDSQKRLAQSAFEFMTEIGYADAEKQTPRLLSFNLERPVEGKVSSSRENTRSTNQTAKYQVHVSARQQQPTEGLSRLMDIMASCIEPVKR